MKSASGPAAGSTAPSGSGLKSPTAQELPPVLYGGRYQILGLLGSGGSGTVYRARDTELGEIVALKLLHRDLLRAPGVLDRFRSEVRLSRKVTHKNVARMFDIGEHAGEKFLTMELIEGESLATVMGADIGQTHALPLSRTIAIATEVCAGLAAAHEVGIVHRDLKPENIMLAKDGRVLITDFGIARMQQQPDKPSAAAEFVGTPAYMSPEQAEGADKIDARSDLFSLGVMLFERISSVGNAAADIPLTPHDVVSQSLPN